jgi:pyridoxamine 5'-phosphate oxidase
VTPISAGEADSYFRSRPRQSQLGAWASEQSKPLESRSILEQRLRDFEEKFAGGEIPRPPHWSGFRLVPARIEFWQEQPFRLHDRFEYTCRDGRWSSQRLFP